MKNLSIFINQNYPHTNSLLDFLNDLNLKFYDNITGNLILEGKANQSSITNQGDSEKYVLCTSYIDFSNLEIIQEKKIQFN